MPDALFDDLPILGELGAALNASMARACTDEQHVTAPASRRPRRWRLRWFGSFLLIGVVSTTAAAGTLTVLRGTPIPGPNAEDQSASMTPTDDSLQVLDLRAPDPDGGHPPFTLRVGRTAAGQTCATVGQLNGNDFGIVGDDGRFRGLASSIVDGCGDHVDGDAAIVGARVFNASAWPDVRTALYGAGASDVRAVTVTERGRTRRIAVRDGAFITAVRGYPEDGGLTLTMRFDDGRIVRHRYAGRGVIVDPQGPAWKVESYVDATRPSRPMRSCVRVRDARPSISGGTATPLVCDLLRGSRSSAPAATWHFAARTFRPGDRGGPDARDLWRYRRAEPRTVIWGFADPQRTTDVTLSGAGYRATQHPRPGGAMAFIVPPTVRTATLRLVIARRGGRTERVTAHALFSEGAR